MKEGGKVTEILGNSQKVFERELAIDISDRFLPNGNGLVLD